MGLLSTIIINIPMSIIMIIMSVICSDSIELEV